MATVRIDGREITSWNSFHDVFAEAFGFPDFYGRNLDAWIDCMTSLDEPLDKMTRIHCKPPDTVVLQLDYVEELFKTDREMFEAIVEGAAFVNWRKMNVGEPPVLTLSFWLDRNHLNV